MRQTASQAPQLEATITSCRYPYWVLAMLGLVNFIHMVDKVALSMFLEPIKKEFLLTDAQLGLLNGTAFALMYAAVGIPLARLADHWIRQRIIFLSITLWSAMTAVCGLVQNFPQLLLARVFVGIGEAGSGPASQSMIADYFPREKRSSALSLFVIGAYLGLFAGMSLGGYLADIFGWRFGIVAIGLPGVAVALLFALVVKEPPRTVTPELGFRAGIQGLLVHPRALFHFLAAMSSASFFSWGAMTFLPSFYIRSFSMTGTQVGLFLGLNIGISSALGTLIGGKLADKAVRRDPGWGAYITALLGIIIMPIYAWQFLTSSIEVSLACGVLSFLIASVGVGPVYSILMDIVRPDARATAMALLGIATMIFGQALGPIAHGALSDTLKLFAGKESMRYVLTISAILSIWPSYHFWRLAVEVRKIRLS